MKSTIGKIQIVGNLITLCLSHEQDDWCFEDEIVYGRIISKSNRFGIEEKHFDIISQQDFQSEFERRFIGDRK